MKKIISVLIALALVFSLTACSGADSSDGSAGDANQPTASGELTLSLHANADALTGTDNITFFVCDSENENEGVLLNIKAPDLLKNISTKEDSYGGSASRLINDVINLRLFRNSASNFKDSYFSFNGYGEFKIRNKNGSEDSIQGETLSQDGCLTFAKNGDEYKIWAKDKDYLLSISAEGFNGYRITDEAGYKELYDTVKEHFTFAKVKLDSVTKNGVVYKVPNLSTAIIFGEENPTNKVKEWTFASDVLYKSLENVGISLVTAHCITSEGSKIVAPCILEDEVAEGGQPQSIEVAFSPVENESFDRAPSENEFSIGNIKFREDTQGANRGNGKGFIIKTGTSTEYICDVYPRGSISGTKLDINSAKAYLEKIILAK